MTISPLADRLRPTSLDELVGQDHLLYPGSPLTRMLDNDFSTPSIMLLGPPAVGKTSLAHIIAATTNRRFAELSATSAGVKDVRATIEAARRALKPADGATPTATIVFIDEIHRFSKSQQDILLPAVEDGTICLIGATTENPSFSINPALRSRTILLTLCPLDATALSTLIDRALSHPDGLTDITTVDSAARETLIRLASGDSRHMLTVLELAAGVATADNRTTVTDGDVTTVMPSALLRYDAGGDMHYDVTSAFIKSMRGSDPDAALYWLARMIASGEDPRFIARRLIIHAAEDVGLADPSVLTTCVSAAEAVALIGMPEARIPLAEATLAIATAPKSNAAKAGIDTALAAVHDGLTGAVPDYLRDTHYPGATASGAGVGYLFPHAHPGALVKQNYGPVGSDPATLRFYQPTTYGFEAEVSRRLAVIDQVLGKPSR